MATLTVIARRHTVHARRGVPFEVEDTPFVRSMIARGEYVVQGEVIDTLLETDQGSTRADLIDQAKALGLRVPKSWTKARIAQAIEDASEGRTAPQEPLEDQEEGQSPPEVSEAVWEALADEASSE